MKRERKFVKNKVEWLRSLNLGETKKGYFATPQECYVMSVIICRWNKTEAQKKGFLIRAHYFASDNQVEIYTETIK